MNGFWTATFSTPFGTGYGVAYFTDKEVFGGDSGFTYTGAFSATGNTVNAEFKVSPYNKSMQSVFGDNQAFNLSIEGTLQGDRLVGQGRAREPLLRGPI